MTVQLNISDVILQPELNAAQITITPIFSSVIPDVNKQYVDEGLALKVDKELGKSLVSDLEIAKLADYPELDIVNGAANKFLNERGEIVEVSHENLTDKNSEAAFQHVDTTVTKEALDEADKVPLWDSDSGKVVLTPKSNFVEAKPDVWYPLTLRNGWVNVSETDKASFLKDSIGVIHLRGRIKDGGAGAYGFSLPLGFYREGITMEHPLVSGYGSYGRLLIIGTGACYINVDYTVKVELSSISFKL